MYGSGIPDIILEMTLMKLAAPVQNFVAMPIPTPTQNIQPNENLDEGQKIFYDTLNRLGREDKSFNATLDKAVVTSFADDLLTLGFRSDVFVNLFEKIQEQFERTSSEIAGRAIKISVVVDKNLPPPVLKNMSESERLNLVGAMKVFNASDATKVSG